LEALEPRCVLSGAATGLAGVVDLTPLGRAIAPLPNSGAGMPIRVAPAANPLTNPSFREFATPTHPVEIVFVDARVPNATTVVKDLIAAAVPNRVVVTLDPSRDGVRQITEVLSAYRNVAAVHIISHGEDGAVLIGDTLLTTAGLDTATDSAAISSWKNALAPGADILLYGCDVAENADGKAFVQDLARLTAANVSASTNLTGPSSLGGNWTLEYQTGTITGGGLVDALLMRDCYGLLAITSNGPSFSASTGLLGATSLTWTDTVANGQNRVMFVELDIDGLGASVAGVTFGGVALTQVGRATGNHAVEIWSLINPAVQTANVVASFNATTYATGGATTFNGVDQTSPTGTFVGNAGTGLASSIVVTSATNDVVLDVENWESNSVSYTPGVGEVQQWTQTDPVQRGLSVTAAGAPSVTLTTSVPSSTQWEVGAVSIHAATNNAPVLSGSNNLTTINENPTSNPGTLVSSLITGYVTDPDAGAVTGIAVTGVDNTNGTWQFSTDAGTTWTAFGSPSQTAALLLAANTTTYVRFVPNANWYGTVSNGLTFQAWDQTSGTAGTSADVSTNGGSTAFSSTKASSSIIVTNSVKITVPSGQNTNENTSVVFSTANGNPITLNDPNGVNDQITISVANGTLTLASVVGLAFSVGTGTANPTMTFSGTTSAINAALNGLIYTPTANYVGSDTLSVFDISSLLLSLNIDTSLVGHYTFKNTSALGTDTSPAAANNATNSGGTSVNDATRGNVLNLSGGASEQITGLFGKPANVTLSAWVNLTSAGTSGADVISLGDSVGIVLDNGGRLDGFYYNGNNWPQTFYSGTLAGTGWHHVAFTFDKTNQVVQLYLDGSLVGSQSTLTDSITYNQGANTFIGKHGNGGTTWNFTGEIDDVRIYNRALTAQEIATLANDLSMIATNTVATTINPVNHAPTLGYTGLQSLPSTNEDTTSAATKVSVMLFTAMETDVDLGALSGIAVVSTTGNGIFQFSTDNITWSNFGSVSLNNALLLDSGTLIRYVPDGKTSETATLSFKAWDQTTGIASTNGLPQYSSAATTGGTTAFSTQTDTALQGVSYINNPPLGTSKSVTLLEDSSYVFTTGDFGYSDPNNNPPDNLLAVEITSLPTAGALTDNGVAVTAGQFVNVSDMNSGLLKFTPAIYANGTAYSTFTFQVQDNGGTANGGVDTDPVPKLLTINVTPVNNPPVLTGGSVNNLTVLENSGLTSLGLGSVAFGPGGGPDEASQTLTYSVTTIPDPTYFGSIYLADGTTVVGIGNFSLAQIQGMQFRPAVYRKGGPSFFGFQVVDSGGTANGGVNTLGEFIQLNITPVNNAPAGKSSTVSILQDSTYVFTTSDFGFTDVNDNPPNNFLAVKISSLPGSGTLSDNGTAVTTGQYVPVSDIVSGLLVFTPVSGTFGLAYASFAFQVQDDGGTANGGIDLDPVPRTWTVNVIQKNAHTIFVTTTADTSDGDTSSISSLLLNNGPDHVVSLREAILAADNTPGTNTIAFNIPGSGPQTISLASALPAITNAVTIDGSSQPGFTGTPLVRIDGNTAGDVDCFDLLAGSDGSTIRDLSITGFNGTTNGRAISVVSNNNLVLGNDLGILPDGVSVSGDRVGVDIFGTNNLVGGLTIADRNYFAGDALGATFAKSGSTGNSIEGNWFGEGPFGTILGLPGWGIWAWGGAKGDTVGGIVPGAGNVFGANNNGVVVSDTASSISILRNVIQNSVGIGIDLNNDGVTPNSTTLQNGPNNLMSSPVIASAIFAGNQLAVVGYIGSAPNSVAFAGSTVELYLSDGAVGGHGGSQTYIGTLTADANGDLTGQITLPTGVTLSASSVLTGTATDLLGDTSEFGLNASVTVATTFQNGSFENVTNGGSPSSFYGFGSSAIPNWTIVSGDVELDSGLFQNGLTQPGTHVIDLNGTMPGGIQQSFLTVPGVSYTLSFELAGNVLGGANPKTLIVTAPGSPATFSFDTTGKSSTNLGWVVKSLTFTATSSLSTISFQSTTPGSAGPLIDNVGLSAGISGRIFEDVNYGGGAGRDLLTSNGSVINGAIVELYDAAGNYVASTSTDSTGVYSFPNLPAGQYEVRVVSATVSSTRVGANSSLVPVQTYRTDASSGTPVPVTDHVGGENPTLVDAGLGGTTLSALMTGSTTAESISTVNVGAIPVSGVDFGFNFDTVVNKKDSGQGSLRQFILNANALSNVGLQQVGDVANSENAVFMIANGNPSAGLNTGDVSQFTGGYATINVLTPLPDITDAVNIDATQQYGYSNSPVVQILNEGSPFGTNGIVVSADGCEIAGLAINGFSGNGIELAYVQNTTVRANFLGTLPDGKTAGGNGSGIVVTAGAHNTIGGASAGDRNVISGNINQGIRIEAGSAGNNVFGNYVGVDVSGSVALPNSAQGIELLNSPGNFIGGLYARRNVISGNLGDGVLIDGNKSSNNVVASDWIGMDTNGRKRIANGGNGITVFNAPGTLIGSVAQGTGNIVSGNSGNGVYATGLGTTGLDIEGNVFGLDSSFYTAMPNGLDGIRLDNVPGAVIGAVNGNPVGGGNLMSGNSGYGLSLVNGTTGTQVLDNWIGVNLNGTTASPNGLGGIEISNAPNNIIGGVIAGAGNLISGNNGPGILIGEVNSTGNQIEGNDIGVNVSGTASISNGGDGVSIVNSASNNIIGGSLAGVGNTISGNSGNGITISGIATSGNVIKGNTIGLNGSGTSAVSNGGDGIYLQNTTNTTIGGGLPAERNVVSGNLSLGIEVFGSSSTVIAGNYVGLDVTGSLAIGNQGDGIVLDIGSTNNVIGGSSSGMGNTISGNGSVGVSVTGSGTSNNTVLGNLIGTNNLGTSLVGSQHDDVLLNSGASNNTIGGAASGDANIIGGASYVGVGLFGGNTTNNLILGNCIGTDTSGTNALANSTGLIDDAAQTIIGGTALGNGNVISGNLLDGVDLEGSGGFVLGNEIGTGSSGLTILGNGNNGIAITGGAYTVGGILTGRNVISGNTQNGLLLSGASATGNIILGNLIGTDATGNHPLGNHAVGVYLQNGASGNTIGGTVLGDGNLISGNGSDGIAIDSTVTNTTIQGDLIGVNSTGTSSLQNAQQGIYIQGSSNVVGGSSPNDQNIISGNGANGILIDTTTANANRIQNNRIGTNMTGNSGLSNTLSGVSIQGGTGNQVLSNTVSGNGTAGVTIIGALTMNNIVDGNRIGTDGTGTVSIPNSVGVEIYASSNNKIGNPIVTSGNVISGNTAAGVRIENTGATLNQVQGNLIGTTADGQNALPNGSGVEILGSANNNLIGGPLQSDQNIISGNSLDGVRIATIGSTSNVIQYNRIGTDISGTVPLGNSANGVFITSGSSNLLESNLISNNALSGVGIYSPFASNNMLSGNLIGTDASGSTALPNQVGISIDGSANNIVGGTLSGEGNLVSGNTGEGIYIANTTATGNVIQGNRVGTNMQGILSLANSIGIQIVNAVNTLIGGSPTGSGNVISGNSNSGIFLNGSTSGTQIQGNLIGTDITGSNRLGNQDGIFVASPNNWIGGTSVSTRNVISGNTAYGVLLIDVGTTGNTVSGNFIGTDFSGTNSLGNGADGVAILSGAASNTIGGNLSGSGNIISGNGSNGILISNIGTDNNIVTGNYVGIDVTGTLPVPNLGVGINIDIGASANQIGGTSGSAGNLISENAKEGVVILSGKNNALLDNRIYGNGSLNIDLNGDGVSVNSGRLNPTQANNGMNSPVITSAVVSANSLIVRGYIGTAPGQSIFGNSRVELFLSGGNSFGISEASAFLGYLTADANGNFAGTISVSGLKIGENITATATDQQGDTSELAMTHLVIGLPPTITPALGSLSYTEGNSPLAIDSGVVLNDPGNSFLTGATIRISSNFVLSEDSLAWTVQNGISGTWNATSGTLTLTGNASLAAYQLALESVTYFNSSQNPSALPRSIDFAVTDPFNVSLPASYSLVVVPVNNPPVLTLPGTNLRYDERSGPLVIGSGISITDVDSPVFNGGILTVWLSGNGFPEDRLGLQDQGTGPGQIGLSGSTVTYGGIVIGNLSGGTDGSTPLAVLFNANASVTAVQSLARDVTYTNAAFISSPLLRSISFTVSDGAGGTSSVSTLSLSINLINVAPTVSVPGPQRVATGKSLVFSSPLENPIVVSDADALGATEQLTITAVGGTVSLANEAGLTILTGTGTSDSLVVFQGNLVALTAALEGLVFAPTSGFAGPASLSVQIDDLGHTGGTTSLTASAVIPIEIADIVVTPLTPLVTSGAGGQAKYSVVLSSKPQGTVSIPVQSSNTTQGVSDKSNLLFDATNWNVPQVVTVTGVDDFVFTGDTTYLMLNGPAVSQDPLYSGMNVPSLTVVNREIDVPGIMTSPTSGLVTTALGGRASFSVVLTSKPLASVTIPLVSSNLLAGVTDLTSLTFDASNWNVPQVVNVMGVQSYLNQGNVQYSVILGPAVSRDQVYNGMIPSSVHLLNLEIPNRPPVLSLPGPQSVPMNVGLVFSTAQGNPLSVSDPDAGGNVISVALSASHGTLFLNPSASVQVVSGVDGSSAVTIEGTIAAINAALDGLRFVPYGNFVGTASLQLLANDLGNTGTGGPATDLATVTINVFNSAPTLQTGLPLSLAELDETFVSSANTGTSVLQVVNSAGVMPIHDVDVGAVPGIAIVGADSTHGVWQYSTNGGWNWSTLSGVSDTSAVVLHLGVNDRLRFLPNPFFVGIASIAFRAWDATDGSLDGTAGVIASIDGGNSAFSTSIGAASVSIRAVEPIPTVGQVCYELNQDAFLQVDQPGLLVRAADLAGDPLQVILVSAPAHGSLLIHADGSMVYRPDAGWSGVDRVVFRASDGQVSSSDTVATLIVHPVYPDSTDTSTAGDSLTPPSSVALGTPPLPNGNQVPGSSNGTSSFGPSVVSSARGGGGGRNPLGPGSSGGVNNSGGGGSSSGGRRPRSQTSSVVVVSANGNGVQGVEGGDSGGGAISQGVSAIAKGAGPLTATSGLSLAFNELSSEFIEPDDNVEVNPRDPRRLSARDLAETSDLRRGESRLAETSPLWHALDALRSEMDDKLRQTVVTVAAVSGLTVSIGYVVWSIRAGYLLAGLMAASPLWGEFDPLAVLEASEGMPWTTLSGKTDDDDEDEETLVTMVDRRHGVRPRRRTSRRFFARRNSPANQQEPGASR